MSHYRSVIYHEKLNNVKNVGMYAHRENSFFSYLLCVSFQRNVIAQGNFVILYFDGEIKWWCDFVVMCVFAISEPADPLSNIV